jgi:hypothetical protein
MEVSAELLGQSDDDFLRATQEAEPVDVLVLHDLAHEFGTVAAQAGNDVVESSTANMMRRMPSAFAGSLSGSALTAGAVFPPRSGESTTCRGARLRSNAHRHSRQECKRSDAFPIAGQHS